MTSETSLYRHYDADGRAIYYGISEEYEKRQGFHRLYSSWPQFSVKCTVETFATRTLAMAAERAAVEADEPLFNEVHNTPGATERLVEYLISKGRYDLLQLRKDPKVRTPKEPKPDRPAPIWDWEAAATRARRQRFYCKSMPVMLLTPAELEDRYTELADFSNAPDPDPGRAVARTLRLQQAMDTPRNRFEFLLEEPLLHSASAEWLDRLIECSRQDNVTMGVLPLLTRHLTMPVGYSFRIYGHMFVGETTWGEEGCYAGEVVSDHVMILDDLWETTLLGDEARGVMLYHRNRA